MRWYMCETGCELLFRGRPAKRATSHQGQRRSAGVTGAKPPSVLKTPCTGPPRYMSATVEGVICVFFLSLFSVTFFCLFVVFLLFFGCVCMCLTNALNTI